MLLVMPTCAEKTKFECTRLFILVLFNDCELHGPWDLTFSEHQLNLPVCVLDSFYLYGLAGSAFDNGLGTISENFSLLIWKAISKVCHSKYHEKILSECLQELKSANSHSDCTLALSILNGLSLNSEFALFFASYESLKSTVEKFIKYTPGSIEDGFVFLGVIKFLSLLPLNHPTVSYLFNEMWPLLLKLSSSNSFPWIQSALNLQFGDVLCAWVNQWSSDQYYLFAKEDEFLRECFKHLLAEEFRPLPFLSIFIPFSNQPCMEKFLQSDNHAQSFIGFLVDIIANRARVNSSFDYLSQKECYLSALLLRNISAVLIRINFNFWGNHWLDNEGFAWLQVNIWFHLF